MLKIAKFDYFIRRQSLRSSKKRTEWDNVEERIKTIRRYLEQEQLFIKNIQSQYDDKPTEKLERELTESGKRAKALEQELNALSSNRTNFLHLSGETSPTNPVFGDPADYQKPSSAKRHKTDASVTGLYDNLQDALASQSPSTKPLENPFEEPPKSPEVFTFQSSERPDSFISKPYGLRRQAVVRQPNRSKSLPGASRYRSDIYKAVKESEEAKLNENGEINDSEDLSDSGITSVNMARPQQQIMSIEDDDFPSEDEKVEDHGPFNDLTLLNKKPAHMAVFLHYSISNSDPTSLLFWLVTDGYDDGSSKEMRRWIYEIYSTFLADGAPLKVDDESTSEVVKKIKSTLTNGKCSEETLRGLLKPLRAAAAKDVSALLSDFRAKRALGLGSLFGDHQLEDDNMDRNKEITVVEQTLVHHLNNLLNEVENLSDPMNFKPSDEQVINQIFRSEALSWSIATFMKNVGITNKGANLNTNVLERCKTFIHKEPSGASFLRSTKKDKKKLTRNHSFHATVYSSTTYCHLCRQLIWGIGHQGYQCQACEYNVHKLRCIDAIDEVCTGKKKERIVTRPESIRRGSSNALKPSENGDLNPSLETKEEPPKRKSCDDRIASPNPSLHSRSDDEFRRASYLEAKPAPNVARSTSMITNKREHSRVKANRSKTEVIPPTVFIPGVTKPEKIADKTSDLTAQVESDEETDSDLEVPTEMPSLKDIIDSKIYNHIKGKDRKRLDTINELIHTERTHVRTLKVLYKVFYKPWMKAKSEYESFGKLLFPNLEELIKIHKSLVQAMMEKKNKHGYVDEIGDVMLNRFNDQPGEEAKEAFAKFCQGQNHALELLKVKQKDKKKLDEFIQQCESNPLCRKLSLQGIISSSYQRLTKYPLFIEGLIKATPANNPDHARLKKVLSICKRILEYVNQAVKEYEDRQRLADFSRKIDKTPLEKSNHKGAEEFKNLDITQHKLIFDGPLTWRMNQTKHIDLHALLLEDLLVLLQKQDDKYVLKCQSMSIKGYQDNKTTHSPVLKLSTVLTRNVATDKKAFFVVGTSDIGPQIYELVAATMVERKNWFKNITEAIESCKGKERGRRNAVVVTSTMKEPSDVENEEFEAKEKDDVESEKNDEKKEDGINKESEKDAIDEKEKDSEEAPELPSKNYLGLDLSSRDRSRSLDDIKNEISVDSPKKNPDGDGFDTDGSTEGFKKNSPDDFSEASEGSSRSSVELIELVKQKDEEIRKLLDEKSRLVEEIRGIPSTEGQASYQGFVSDKSQDARNLVVDSILEANHITDAVTSILSPSDRSQNVEENPLPPQQQLATSTARLNECLTRLLNVIADRDMNREKLQCDLQYYRALIHKLEQERSPRTSNPSNSDETFLPNNDGQPGNWNVVNGGLAVPDNFNDLSRPPLRSSSFSGCSESSRSSRGSNRNSLVMTDLTDQVDV
ncbi:rho guanine nucleotide exchange factor 11-like isoform X2 [Dendronephthya gigantea]|uniref:rho guanine nucleotide exchange factor 11-like isoform X2 n=1 Tax=Dendronephthya gigantea TaxID=151771 RepID=UPI00106C36DD|nr:rho guanine nucleotide exchange factor 11-like isoform X2 [Dendronephthya gigantea]